jgi:hypothetical protein
MSAICREKRNLRVTSVTTWLKIESSALDPKATGQDASVRRYSPTLELFRCLLGAAGLV